MSDIIEEARDLEDDRINVLDDAADDDSTAPQTYNISSYGADFDVDGLVKRLERGDILIPPFQRDYVWNLSDASRFIESLLLGLPVPGVFLAKDPDTNKSLVIDGQQRLKTLQFFFSGDFNPKPDRKTRRVFKLSNVQPQFEGKTYNELEERDRVRLNDTIIHATIVKQESPTGDDTSVYHVFERLNTGGRKLMPQEIRTAIFHGPLVDFLHKLNAVPSWRSVFGPESNRLKDKELILRFLALYFESDHYIKPMSEFLNKFSKKHRASDVAFLAHCENIFTTTIDLVAKALGKEAFRPERSLNAAVFDSVMVCLARRLATGNVVSPDAFKAAYTALLTDADFRASTSDATSDAGNLEKRIEVATRTFGTL